jgi:hypothetical protein
MNANNIVRFTGDIATIHHNLMAWRQRVTDLTRIGELSHIAKQCTYIHDSAWMQQKPAYHILSNVRDEIEKKRLESKVKGYGGNDVDFNFTVFIIPFRGKVYGHVSYNITAWAMEFYDLPWVSHEPYFYTDNYPDGMTETQWKERGNLYADMIYNDYNSFKNISLVAECTDDRHITFEIDELLKYVPSNAERTHSLALSNLRDQYFRENSDGTELSNKDTSPMMKLIFAAEDWIKNDAVGMERLRQTKEAIGKRLPPITAHALTLSEDKAASA